MVSKKPKSIRNTAMDLLARREHSADELHAKLKQRDFDKAEINDAIQHLQLDNLQSDQRFTEAYINQRVNAGFGPLKIKNDLRHKGITEATIESCLENYSGEWYSRMVELRERKYGAEIPEDYRLKMKQARFLQGRGFAADEIMRLFS